MPLAGDRIKASDLDFPLTQARATTGTSLATNAWTPILLQTEDYDDDNMHSTSVNTSRFTAQRAGRYECYGGVGHGSGTTNRRGAKLAVNGVAWPSSSTLISANSVAGGTMIPTRSLVITMAIGDYLELHGFQDSGAALVTLTTGENMPSLTCRYLGPP